MSIGLAGNYERHKARPFALQTLAEHTGLNRVDLARAFGVDYRQIMRWNGIGLTATQADDAAVILGLHPGEVWEQWWEDQS